MSAVELKVSKRETGKVATKAVRNEGMVPGVFYGKEQEATPIAVAPLDLRNVVFTDTANVIKIELDGNNFDCILKDVTFDPITDEVKHFDLQVLTPGRPIIVNVPFRLVGSSKGVLLGGILSHVLRRTKIKCTPESLVDFVEVDISHLDIGDTIGLNEIRDEAKFEYLVKENAVIAQILKPRVKKTVAAAAE